MARVDVGGNEAVADDFPAGVAVEADVLAHLGDGGDAVGFEVSGGVPGNLLGQLVAEAAELFVLADEVSLAIDFEQDPNLGAGDDVLGDDSFVGGAVGLLRCAGNAFLAKPVHGEVEVALVFGEGFLAVHQARSGHFAELAYACGSDFRHMCGELKIEC